MNTLLKARSQWQLPGRLELPFEDLRLVERHGLSGQAIASALSQAPRGGKKAAD
jgi:hypothetical protein